MWGTLEAVLAAVAFIFVLWCALVLPLVMFAILSDRARCSESDAIIAEAQAGEMRRMEAAHV